MAYVVTRVSGRAPGSCVGALLVMTAVVAFAQGGANLGGAVRDNTGGALPGATVTITGVPALPYLTPLPIRLCSSCDSWT